jgi:lambda family phage portal protein
MPRDWLGEVIGVLSPRAGYQRAAWRSGYEALRDLNHSRSYAAARRDRLSNDWIANGGSQDAEVSRDLWTLRNRQRQMRRDDTYAASICRVYTTFLVGDGITATAQHPDTAIAKAAQTAWDTWASSPVDGRSDFYGVQKTAISSLLDGDVLVSWSNVGGEPNARVRVLEGDYLDARRNQLLEDGGRIVQGVEYGPDGVVRAYWLFQNHPGDVFGFNGGKSLMSVRTLAADVGLMFETLRAGQSRGVPWLYAAMGKLRDVSDIEESIRIKKRVEACLSVFRSPGETGTPSPLGEQQTNPGTSNFETLRPGMIIQGQPGETITAINPSQSGDGDGFLRAAKMSAAAAAGVPYHLATGDVSQANYSSLRADVVPFYQRLDEVTAHVIQPFLDDAFRRRMQVAALKLRLPALSDVRADWTPPDRPWVDPLKEMQAEKMEVRSIPGEFARMCARRGIDWRKAIVLQAEINKFLDDNRVALDSDPRRLDGLGQIQPPASYLADPSKAAQADAEAA